MPELTCRFRSCSRYCFYKLKFCNVLWLLICTSWGDSGYKVVSEQKIGGGGRGGDGTGTTTLNQASRERCFSIADIYNKHAILIISAGTDVKYCQKGTSRYMMGTHSQTTPGELGYSEGQF